MDAHYNMVTNFGENVVAFIAMPETREIVRSKNIILKIYIFWQKFNSLFRRLVSSDISAKKRKLNPKQSKNAVLFTIVRGE